MIMIMSMSMSMIKRDGCGPEAHDPSVRDYADTSPAKLGRSMNTHPPHPSSQTFSA